MLVTQEYLTTFLKSRFGFENFRPGQSEAIIALMQENRLICIQPTGHGKSLLYQLPSLLLEGITLVISPLLALMRDQMMQLKNRFNIPAAAINSDQSEEENHRARAQARSGQIKILFVAPEQLDNLSQFEFLLNLPVSLLVVDEAHCISMWGHDFRPSYRQIIQLVYAIAKKNPQLKLLGLTATANEKTEKDIRQQLTAEGAHSVRLHRESMNRPNIQLSVFSVSSIAAKLAMIGKLLMQLQGDGLVYCATRENTELVASYLQQQKIHAVAYHAGMDAGTKRQLQREFTQGNYKVIAATNALGMGIDKADLRFIIHFDVPGSITAYYQEVGRCGRDGLPAQGIILFNLADKRIQEYFIHSAEPAPEHFELILQLVKDATVPPKLTDIKRLAGLHPTIVTVIIAELLEQGYLQKVRQYGSQVYLPTDKKDKPKLARYIQQHQTKIQELSRMLHYADQTHECRMGILRLALGDQVVEACGHCDVCAKKADTLAVDPDAVQVIDEWLTQRSIRTTAMTKDQLSSGVAVFDGKLRTPLFMKFMHERTKVAEIHSDFLQVLKKHVNALAREYSIAAVVPVPSRTWLARDKFAIAIAQVLKVPVFLDFLEWREVPTHRQGELLNNDQRRYNVHQKMVTKLNNSVPEGAILLLDDYIGSGATVQEAARVLRHATHKKQIIVPFTLASIKWRLGRAGMV